MNKEQIFRAQHAINAAGLGPVVVDGVWGPRTAAAYAALVRESDLGGAGVSMPTPAAPKPWWTSRAILGALATIAAGIAGFAGVSLDAGQLSETLTAIATAVGGMLALWGTIKRKAPIDSTRVLPGVRLGPDGLRTGPMRSSTDGANQAERHDGLPKGPFFDT